MAEILISPQVSLTNQEIIEKVKSEHPEIINPRIVSDTTEGKRLKFQLKETQAQKTIEEWAKGLPLKATPRNEADIIIETPTAEQGVGKNIEIAWQAMKDEIEKLIGAHLKGQKPEIVKSSVLATKEMLDSFDKQVKAQIQEFNEAVDEVNKAIEAHENEVKSQTSELREQGNLLAKHQTEIAKQLSSMEEFASSLAREQKDFFNRVNNVFNMWNNKS